MTAYALGGELSFQNPEGFAWSSMFWRRVLSLQLRQNQSLC